MNDSLITALLTALEAKESVALLTVVQANGAYADALGSRAVLRPTGDSAGKLGLGQLTEQVLTEARQSLHSRRPRLLTYEEPDGSAQIFVEVQRQPPQLIIVGAGHVARPLAELGKLIDFEVVVLDDRPKYANKQRFPMADEVLARPLTETLRTWPINTDTFIVLVTRGHSHDVECLLEVLDSPARYIGMIGSKRRVQAVFELLEKEKGIARHKFDRVYAPIGLDIGAQNPAEIAVSIIAEIINIFRGGRTTSLSDALRADPRLPLHPNRGND